MEFHWFRYYRYYPLGIQVSWAEYERTLLIEIDLIFGTAQIRIGRRARG